MGVEIVDGVDGRGRENARYRRLRFGVLGVDLVDFFVGKRLEPSSSRMRDLDRWDCSGSARYQTYGASVLENVEQDTKGLAGGFCELLLPE